MNNPKISVIVPVYNAERYLKTGVESIIKQTYKNIEIILINDGSTDNSGKICDNYAKVDNRIHVFHKKLLCLLHTSDKASSGNLLM